MIAIVCGGRRYADAARVTKILDAAVDRLGVHTIIEGGAGRKDEDTGRAIDGADLLAWQWAVDRGDIAWIEVPAAWGEPGKTNREIGHGRNHMMLVMLMRAKEDIAVIAFPGGGGTAHMKKIARIAKVRIIEVDPVREVAGA